MTPDKIFVKIKLSAQILVKRIWDRICDYKLNFGDFTCIYIISADLFRQINNNVGGGEKKIVKTCMV
jgi:hypothetical protein